jgi:hypothetical protein
LGIGFGGFGGFGVFGCCKRTLAVILLCWLGLSGF